MSRPNIVFYFSDQQRWDTMGCYGQKLNVTPVLDRLASEGAVFENAYTCQPVCGPARACLQTGLYATQANCHKNDRILPEGADTLARRLDNAGYETSYVGKWHLASQPGSSYQTDAIPESRRGGYRHWMAADTLEFTSHGYNGYMYDGNMNRHDFVGHRIDCVNAFAVDYLHDYAARGAEKPFFLFVSHLDPHHQNDRNRYEGPDGSKKRFRDFEVPGDLLGKAGDWKENYPDYLGQCNLIDQNVGKLFDTLDELNLMDNTIFLYASDHGSHFRTRNAEYKRACEDGCLHIPLIAWGGPFAGRGRIDDMVSLIDVPSTILDAAGLEIPSHYQGSSLVRLVTGEADCWPDAVYAQISEAQTARTVRTKAYKYAVAAPEFIMDDMYSAVYREDKLYDLEKDPFENNNLVSDPAYASVRRDMRRRLIDFMKKAGEPEAKILPAE